MVKVAIAGCGSITQFRHAPEYAANPAAGICGFFDIFPGRAQELAEKFGGRAYETFDSLLADAAVEAVSICTANSTHAEMAIRALKAGKHVLCEKPMATTLDEARMMTATAKETGKFLMVGHNQRLVPAHKAARALIERGDIGRVLSFRAVFSHPGPEAWGVDKTNATWFFKKDAAGFGSLADLGVHKVDLVRWLLADDVAEVSSFLATLDKRDGEGQPIGVDDNSVSILRMRSGAVGTLTTGWTNYGPEDNTTIIYGTAGVLEIFTDPDWSIKVTLKSGEMACYRVGGIQTNTNQTNSGVIDLFVECLERNRYPEISGEDALRVMEIIFAMDESNRLRKAVSL